MGFREAKKDLGLEWGGLVFEKMKVLEGKETHFLCCNENFHFLVHFYLLFLDWASFVTPVP